MTPIRTATLIKKPKPEPFDFARSLHNLANGYRIIAIELDKMASAGVTIEQLKELGIVKSV